MGSEPNLAELVGDILSVDSAPIQERPPPVKPSKSSYKPKGLFLGERRDNGKPVDIAPQVLARHAAMLGSTGSGKTVMAKALIEEAAIAKIPSLIIDPQGDLARLALGIAPADLAEHGGDYTRAQRSCLTCVKSGFGLL
ncbi:MAG: helicase HerA-like domain-containing protein [Candidatus Poseidoniaceae archaeon]